MNEPFNYSTTFVLDKAHFNECFSNSVEKQPPLVAYQKAMGFAVVGLLVLLFTQVNPYIAYFIIGLGLVEALGKYYQQPWWVTRQMLSRNAKSEVTLTLDHQGIHSDSAYTNALISWQDVSEVNDTKDGLIVIHKKGRSYISTSCLSSTAVEFIKAKGQQPA